MPADFTLLYGNLAVGGAILTAESMRELAEDGFTHIIDCQAQFDDTPLAEPFGIKVLWLPLFDDFNQPDFENFRRVEAFVEDSLMKDPKKYKLLTHCFLPGMVVGDYIPYKI